MEGFDLSRGGAVVRRMAAVIQENQTRLGEIDGAIGDGDHGVNMAKGFRLADATLEGRDAGLAEGFRTLGETLLGDIGGSMGPIYGSFFVEMADSIEGMDTLDRDGFSRMLAAGIAAVQDLGEAKVGDKTLVDVLIPAREAFDAAAGEERPFGECLAAMDAAALAGFEATRNMIARVGRAARLGERSRGTPDAGAASCQLLLHELAEGMRRA